MKCIVSETISTVTDISRFLATLNTVLVNNMGVMRLPAGSYSKPCSCDCPVRSVRSRSSGAAVALLYAGEPVLCVIVFILWCPRSLYNPRENSNNKREKSNISRSRYGNPPHL